DDRGDAGKMAAADEPTLATGLAPHDFRAHANRVAAFAGDRDADLAGGQFDIVNQANPGGGDLSTESRIALSVIGLDRHWPEKGVPHLAATVLVFLALGFDDQLIDRLAR